MKKLFLVLIVYISWPSSGFTQIINPSRTIQWQGNVGVTGDIPTNRSACTTSACNSVFGGSVSAASINAAILSAPANTVVRIPAGTYDLTSSIQPKSNVTLRGAGMGVTILRGAPGFSGDGLISFGDIGNWYLSDQPSYDLVNPRKGDTTITTTSNHNWSAGDYIQVDMLEDPSGDPVITLQGGEGMGGIGQSCRTGSLPCRPTGQTVKIVSIPAANRAVIDQPLYWTYNQSPQATKISSYHIGMGFEDFTLDNGLSGNGKILHFSGAFESWVLRVEFINVQTYGLFVYGAYKSTVRSCKFHEGYAGSGGGYTIMIWNRASANLFEDNIIYKLGIMVLMDGSVTGNVFAYNFGTAPTYGGNAAGTEFGTHGAHPMFNLFEGNQFEGRFRFDYTWGSNSHGTVFRNRVINDTNPNYNAVRNLVDLWAYSRYYNIVGNILGTVGRETIYEEATGAPNSSALVVYAFGETLLFNTRGADPGVKATVFRQGNWDSVHNAVRWDEDIVNPNHTLPNSLYLSAKPAWFGGCTWPPFSPVGPTINDIPAKLRYQGSSCGPAVNVDTTPPTVSIRIN